MSEDDEDVLRVSVPVLDPQKALQYLSGVM